MEQSIEEMNKAIAIWMKRQIDGSRILVDGKRWIGMKYHSSWDWLKPVIDEIFTYTLAHSHEVRNVTSMSIVVEIKAAHKRVYDFITWHNSQNKI